MKLFKIIQTSIAVMQEKITYFTKKWAKGRGKNIDLIFKKFICSFINVHLNIIIERTFCVYFVLFLVLVGFNLCIIKVVAFWITTVIYCIKWPIYIVVLLLQYKFPIFVIFGKLYSWQKQLRFNFWTTSFFVFLTLIYDFKFKPPFSTNTCYCFIKPNFRSGLKLGFS